MTQKSELYICEICGNMAEIVINKEGILICCGKEMKKLTPKTADIGEEKHLPSIKRENGEIMIQVGEIEHPMAEEHYIQFIEVISNDKKYLKRKYLKPDDKPTLKFKCNCEEKIISRAYCNIHGLWSNIENKQDE